MKRPSTPIRLLGAVAASAMLLAGCASTANTSAAYKGSGGMTAYQIKPEVYLHHYTQGFTGVDAMGWNPNLQHAWSRLAAAQTCGIAYDREQAIKQLLAVYGQDDLTHRSVGIGFHHNQSKAIAGFCTPERVAEINKLLPQMLAGQFAKLF
jgi:hypothetical protein